MMTTNTSNTSRITEVARQKLAQNIVYLDTETTGLSNTDEIIEIGIVDAQGATLFESYIRPSQPITAGAAAVHHITQDMVNSAPMWVQLWPQIRSVLSGKVIAIYNAEFDLRLMQQTHSRYKQPWREALNTFCIMKLYAEMRGEWNSVRRTYRYFSLEEAGRASGIPLPNSHRAVDDALLARALLEYMAK